MLVESLVGGLIICAWEQMFQVVFCFWFMVTTPLPVETNDLTTRAIISSGKTFASWAIKLITVICPFKELMIEDNKQLCAIRSVTFDSEITEKANIDFVEQGNVFELSSPAVVQYGIHLTHEKNNISQVTQKPCHIKPERINCLTIRIIICWVKQHSTVGKGVVMTTVLWPKNSLFFITRLNWTLQMMERQPTSQQHY